MSSSEPAPTDAESWVEHELAARRELVEAELDRCLPREAGQPSQLPTAMRYAALGGGKRLRPVLTLAAAEACGGDPQRALPAATAVELVHCYSLVHDDLPAMDDDDLRRGRPTCHKVFGDALAILAGDALLTLAFEVLANRVVDKALAAELVLELATHAGESGMAGGQAADVQFGGGPPSPGLIDYIHKHKTGSLIEAAVRMGALAVGARREEVAALSAYGERVGLAFQIADDILDVTSLPGELGKATHKDLTEGKLTYPRVVGLAEARRAAARLAEEAVAELTPFAERGRLLAELARFVVNRSR